jgi:hypothetical protein
VELVNLQVRKVTEKKKILNFIHSEIKPFSADQVVSFTGVDRRVVTNYLRFCEKEGLIGKIGKEGQGWIYSKKFTSHEAGITAITYVILGELFLQEIRNPANWFHDYKLSV